MMFSVARTRVDVAVLFIILGSAEHQIPPLSPLERVSLMLAVSQDKQSDSTTWRSDERFPGVYVFGRNTINRNDLITRLYSGEPCRAVPNNVSDDAVFVEKKANGGRALWLDHIHRAESIDNVSTPSGLSGLADHDGRTRDDEKHHHEHSEQWTQSGPAHSGSWVWHGRFLRNGLVPTTVAQVA